MEIVNLSLNEGLIANHVRDSMDILVKIRNMLVHNNGIADETTTYVVDGVTLHLEEGKMASAKLGLFLLLTLEAVQRYDEWIRGLAGMEPAIIDV